MAAINTSSHNRRDLSQSRGTAKPGYRRYNTNSNRTGTPTQYSSRDHQPQPNRGQSKHHGPPANRQQFTSQGQPNYYPHVPPSWAAYWAPPPCPYPTQEGWAGQWAAPSAPPQQTRAPQQSSCAQAHVTEVNPLEPRELGAAFQAMSLDSSQPEWLMDTGASDHLTHNQGIPDWEDPEPSQQ
ncbi:uncharacterized protein LOC143604447 [Bidens hawaiensis]|uniref:uncharacterized protein LOC143604447 n=1 Tax=Bidens hawaiensis TaxID=980011 RepID=UPI00404B4731